MSIWKASQPLLTSSHCKARNRPRLPASNSVSLLVSSTALKPKWAGGAGGAAGTEIIKAWGASWVYILDEASNQTLIPTPVLDICNTQNVDGTVFLGEREEGATPFGAPTGLFYPSDIRRWHGGAKCQRGLTPMTFFPVIKGKTLGW